jgi:hypothetical protein
MADNACSGAFCGFRSHLYSKFLSESRYSRRLERLPQSHDMGAQHLRLMRTAFPRSRPTADRPVDRCPRVREVNKASVNATHLLCQGPLADYFPSGNG